MKLPANNLYDFVSLVANLVLDSKIYINLTKLKGEVTSIEITSDIALKLRQVDLMFCKLI